MTLWLPPIDPFTVPDDLFMKINQYRYIGDLPFLQGCTAIGEFRASQVLRDEYLPSGFYVQVDQHDHPWMCFWHRTNHLHWEFIK